MSIFTINDIVNSTDRHKLFYVNCPNNELNSAIKYIQSKGISVLNVGMELSFFINKIDNYKFLHIETYEYLIQLFNENKSILKEAGNPIISIYNIGILLEPKLELNVVQIIKEISKTMAVILIWENNIEDSNKLTWDNQKKFNLDFTETPLKKLQYAI